MSTTVPAFIIEYSILSAVGTALAATALSIVCRNNHLMTTVGAFSSACRFKKGQLTALWALFSGHDPLPPYMVYDVKFVDFTLD